MFQHYALSSYVLTCAPLIHTPRLHAGFAGYTQRLRSRVSASPRVLSPVCRGRRLFCLCALASPSSAKFRAT